MPLPTAYTTVAADAVVQMVRRLDDAEGPYESRGPERIQALRHMIRVAEEAVTHEVHRAREAGESWAVIGAALGTTRQSAQAVYGRPVTRT